MVSLVAQTTEQQLSEFDLAGMPGAWMRLGGLLLIAAAAFLVFWLYRREARVGASARLRMTLATLRTLVILLLALVWLEPVIATYSIRTVAAHVVVLADVSASMSIADTDDVEDGATRVERAAKLMNKNQFNWLKRLAAGNELSVYAFGDRLVALPFEGITTESSRVAQPQPALAADAPRTNLGSALSTVFDDLAEGPIAGVIVLTDGAINAGMQADDVAAYARRIGAPLYPVGIGSPTPPANLRVAGFSAPATTPKGDPLELRVEVAAEGIEPGDVRVELTRRRAGVADEDETLVASREVTLAADAGVQTLRFTVDADQAGEFLYRVRVPKIPGEAVTIDNSRGATVVVLDERLRVLLISGRPSYDYRYVTRLLERDKTVDLSCWLQSADPTALRDGNTVLSELPRRPEDLFAYDAILMMDPDPRELDSSWAITARRFVDEFGGGLLLQAGPHNTSRFLNDARLDDLIKIMPVVFDPDAQVRLSEQGGFRTQAYPMIVANGGVHPLLRLHDDPQMNALVWKALPGVWWYLPVLREKPLASVLLRHSGRAHVNRFGQPILFASQPVGAGRAVFLGFDGVWRWRASAEQYYERFWVQLVRYLAQARRQGASKRGTIVLDRESYDIGDYARIEARVLDERFVPWHEDSVAARIQIADGNDRDLTLTAVPGRAAWFAARMAIDWSGPTIIRIPLPQSSGAAASENAALVKHLTVHSHDVELRSLRMQRAALEKLATQTGGEYFSLAAASELPDKIPSAQEVKSTRLADRALWDNAWVMGLIAALLGVEWFLRRRNHLL